MRQTAINRAKKVLNNIPLANCFMNIPTYRDHYSSCRERYKDTRVNMEMLYQFKYKVIKPNLENQDDVVAISNTSLAIIENLSSELTARFAEKEKKGGQKELFICERNIYDIPWLEDLAKAIIPQLEKNLFGCFCVVESCFIYRNIYSPMEAHSSWLPHYDNTPKEVIKIMVYLSDVPSDEYAPITLLLKEGEAIKADTTRIDINNWHPPKNNSRISKEELNALFDLGYRFSPILGKMGTIIIFDNNIIHKATRAALGKFRDVVVLMVRPWRERMENYINRKTTGTFDHRTIFINPLDI